VDIASRLCPSADSFPRFARPVIDNRFSHLRPA
jgi:hypothetical protein